MQGLKVNLTDLVERAGDRLAVECRDGLEDGAQEEKASGDEEGGLATEAIGYECCGHGPKEAAW
jgi:hypothetical protein